MYSASSGGGGVGDADGVENGENEFGGAAKATAESETKQAIIWRVFMAPNLALLEENAKRAGGDCWKISMILIRRSAEIWRDPWPKPKGLSAKHTKEQIGRKGPPMTRIDFGAGL